MRENRLRGFPPEWDARAESLVLGSMPGAASLAAGRYYAHPRNQFWRLVGDLFCGGKLPGYEEGLAVLRKNRVALWDVIKTCRRSGSLDTAISDEAPNDFAAFFAAHPRIRRVFFNGTKAETSFRRLVLPRLTDGARITFARLPSTSPAHASLSYGAKLALWRKALARNAR